MADYVEKWGDSIEEAVDLALQDLKVTRDEVVVTVLEQPSRGFLGLFGNKLAKVRVEKKTAKTKERTGKSDREEIEVRADRKSGRKKRNTDRSVSRDTEKTAEGMALHTEDSDRDRGTEAVKTVAEPEFTETVSTESEDTFSSSQAAERNESISAVPVRERSASRKQRNGKKGRSASFHTKFTISEEDEEAVLVEDAPGVAFIEAIASDMGLHIETRAHVLGDTLYVEMLGRDVGTLIGKRGQTLDAVQYLASIVQNKNTDKHLRMVLNAENYREKREKTLQQLARRLGDKCSKTGRSVQLEPMNPYERKVIHSTLQNHPKVTTRSEGVEPGRRVIIELKDRTGNSK